MKGSDEDYEELFEKIRKFPAYAHVLKSSWIIKSNKSAETIRDELNNSTSASIRILITKMGFGGAAFLDSDDIDYLVHNLQWKSTD